MPSRDDNRRFLKSGALLSGIVLTEAVAGGLYLIAINRFLGPADYGLWSYALAAYVLAIAIVAVGFESVLHFAYGDDQKTGDELVSAALFWRIVLGAAACAGFVIFAVYHRSEPPLPLILLLVVPAILGRGVAALIRSAFVAKERVAPVFQISVAFRFAELIAGAALLFGGAGLIKLVALHSLVWLIEAGFSARRLRGELRFSFRAPPRMMTARLFRLGAPRAVLNGALVFMISAPIILYRPLAGDPGEVGFFALALQLITLTFWAAQAFVNASSPNLARRAEAGELMDMRIGMQVLLFALVIFGAAAMGLAVLGAPAFEVVFGPEYAPAAIFAAAACVIGALQLAPNGFQQVMLARRIHWPAIAANIGGGAVIIVGFGMAAPGLAPLGAIWIAVAGWAVRAMIIFVIAVFGQVNSA